MFCCGLPFTFFGRMQENYGSGNAEAEADGNVWNTLAVTFEVNAPTKRAKRFATFPLSLAFEDVRLARSWLVGSDRACSPFDGQAGSYPVAAALAASAFPAKEARSIDSMAVLRGE